MVGIGLRVYSNSEIFYSVIDEVNGNLDYKVISSLLIPQALEKPEQLHYTRNTLLDIFNEYNVTRAGIRLSEYTGQVATSGIIERYYLEGLIQESVASSTIEKYFAGQISTITPILGILKESFKKYADGDEVYPFIPVSINWNDLSLEKRESIMVCHCALKI